MTLSLEGKVAIVTGAGSGIGRAVALAYAGHGASVVVSDINETGDEETVAQIGAAGGEGVFQTAGSARPGDNEALVATAVRRFGGLHIACNTASAARKWMSANARRKIGTA